MSALVVAAMSWAIDSDDIYLAFRLLRARRGPIYHGFRLSLPSETALSLRNAPEHPDYPYALAVAAVDAGVRGARQRSEELWSHAVDAERKVGRHAGSEIELWVNTARTTLAFSVDDRDTAAKLSEHRVELARAAGHWETALALAGAAACLVMAGDLDAAMYDLRHTAATPLIDAGVPINAVSERLGHANLNVTLAVYVHSTPAQHDQVTAVLEALVE